jgi:membrane-bound ClpP family serine protease
MTSDYAIWAAIFLGVALILFFVELFIPSGGLIGLGAAASLVTGIVLLFQVNTTLGLASALVAMVAVPFLFAIAIKIWPNTPIARMLQLKNPPPLNELDGGLAGPSGAAGPRLGDKGSALTDLRPVGTCLIGGQRTECLAETGVIRAGTPVVVVAVDGMQTKVRAEENG